MSYNIIKTKRIKYQTALIIGAYHEKKRTVLTVVHLLFNRMEKLTTRNKDLNASFAIKHLFGRIKKIKDIIKNNGSSYGCMMDTLWIIYQRYLDTVLLKLKTSSIIGLIKNLKIPSISIRLNILFMTRHTFTRMDVL